MSQSPKIALFDIETAPSRGYFWGKLYETDIVKVDKPWYILCFSYKWLGEKETHTHSLRDYSGYKRNLEDDEKLIRDLHKLFDSADILVAHNGDRFDIRKTNARFLKYDLPPPSYYRTVDTYKIAKKHFQFDSARLGALAEFLSIGSKLPTTGFDTWERCMSGDPEAWEVMEAYNRHDIELLESVYLKLRPYATLHPNLAVYHGKGTVCPRCQKSKLVKNGTWVTNAAVYQQYRCHACGFTAKGERTSEARRGKRWSTLPTS